MENLSIHFQCAGCGQKMVAPPRYAGRKSHCPKCNRDIVIPTPQANVGEEYKIKDYDSAGLDLDQAGPARQTLTKEQEDEQLRAIEGRLGRTEEKEPPPQRKRSWILDIWLYPANESGLMILGIVIGIPLLINLFMGLAGPFWFMVRFIGYVVYVVLWMYFFWYIARCVHDSAEGGIRAPETMAITPSFGELFWQFFRIFGAFAFYLAPALLYLAYTYRLDWIFWALLGYGVLFFPMGLLATVMFDSLSGVNPVLVVGSVLSTFLPYLGLVLFFWGALLLVRLALIFTGQMQWLGMLVGWGSSYFMLVWAHLIGRFYWRYSEKLNWGL